MSLLVDPQAWIRGAVGGLLIGASASMLLLVSGRIAGISGIIGGLLSEPKRQERLWRLVFLIGLVTGGSLVAHFLPGGSSKPVRSIAAMGFAGLLVGIGTRVGGGCTSGHGVCGLARLSKRSFVATLIFISAAVLTVFVLRRVGDLS